MVVLLFNDTQFAWPKYGGTQYTRQKYATIMEMDCGACIILIRLRIPDQVYCNQSQKNNTFLFKTFILQKYALFPFYTDLGLPCTLLSCEC